MAEIRAQVAYHFKFNPAEQLIGALRIPEQITRTIAVGDEIVTEKIAGAAIPDADRAVLLVEMEKQVREAQRTAKPVGTAAAEPAKAEESAF